MQNKQWIPFIFVTFVLFSLTACSEELLNQLLDENSVSSSAEQEQTLDSDSVGNPEVAPSSSERSFQQEVLMWVNQERNAQGLKALSLNATLSKAAQGHAENMIKTGEFAHVINGKNVGDRTTAAGYRWGRVGENIASGQKSAEAVMQTWMNSEGHRANILKAEFEELGVGYAKDSDGTPYWVQVFGTPF